MAGCRWPLGNGYFLSFTAQNGVCIEVDAAVTYVMLKWNNWEQFREFIEVCSQFHDVHNGMEPPDISKIEPHAFVPDVILKAFEPT